MFLTNAEKYAAAVSARLPEIMASRAPAPEEIMRFADIIVTSTLHKVMAGYTYHPDGTAPAPDEIFVFGSNLSGIHGAGAAKAAVDKYGAILGVGQGLVGRSYALPTKDERIQTLRLERVELFVAAFKQHAIDNPDKKYFVTRVGCGLAGYVDEDIAPMFRGAPPNCNFPEEWRAYLEPSEVAKQLIDEAAAVSHAEEAAWRKKAVAELIRLTTELGVLRVNKEGGV